MDDYAHDWSEDYNIKSNMHEIDWSSKMFEHQKIMEI